MPRYSFKEISPSGPTYDCFCFLHESFGQWIGEMPRGYELGYAWETLLALFFLSEECVCARYYSSNWPSNFEIPPSTMGDSTAVSTANPDLELDYPLASIFLEPLVLPSSIFKKLLVCRTLDFCWKIYRLELLPWIASGNKPPSSCFEWPIVMDPRLFLVFRIF